MENSSKTKLGRPTKYREEFCDDIIKFFADCIRAKDLPLLEDWCTMHRISVDMIKDWSDRYDNFRLAVGFCKAMQKSMMIKDAYFGRSAGKFTEFLLTTIHQMRPEEVIDLKSSDKSMSPVFNFIRKVPEKKED